MRDGWIKVHRALLGKAIWKCTSSANRSVLMTLLLMANHEQNEWIWDSEKYECSPGEFITSLSKISELSRESTQSVRSSIALFEKRYDFLTKQSTKQSTKIKILNWDKYQIDRDEENNCQQGDQQGDQHRPNTDPTQPELNQGSVCEDGERKPNNYKELKKTNKKTFCPNSDEFRLADGLFKLMKNNNPKIKEPNLQVWAGHVDKMLRIDRRTFEEIEVRIRWSQKNHFWHKNIRSTEKLRHQFDRLTDEMKADKRTNQYGKEDPKPIGEAYRDKTYEDFLELGYSEDDAKWQLELQEKRNAIRPH